MKWYDYTSMGGSIEAFLTTQWSDVRKIKAAEEGCAQSLVNELAKRYWKPVYCYLRHRGYDNEQAKDLTQGFFQEVVLGRRLLQQANKAKGRFRRFLLTALQRYVTSVQRRQTADKRRPKGMLLGLDHVDPTDLPALINQLTPEKSFNYAWVSCLLDELLEEVETACRRQGMTAHWQLFHDRVLRPTMEEVPAPSLKELCEEYGVENPNRASNMTISVNRRFQAALKRRLRQSVASDPEVCEELRELMQMFCKKSAG